MFFKAFQIMALATIVLGLPAEQPSSGTNTLRHPPFTVTWQTWALTETPGSWGHAKRSESTSSTTQAPPPSLTTSPTYVPVPGTWPTFPYSPDYPTSSTTSTTSTSHSV
ncbi:hypothetical protein K449DRAFT_77630 [Hypoxylon sp. EC38]|nr:hypothetical protein K449DRAFT_77630 [Hypoxylon sp. EC38]